MNNKTIINRQAKSDRKKGLLLVIAASLVLIVLAVYKVPLFQNELHGIIIGVSEVHNETDTKLIATVHLDNGDQVLATMPRDLQIRKDGKTSLMEGTSIFGRKSYKIVTGNE